VGFRKINADTGSWIARMRDERGAKVYHSLGYVSPQLDFEQARQAALDWFSAQDAGVKSVETTVAAACKAYIEDRRAAKGEQCARDAEARFERTVYEAPIGSVPVAKLRTPRLKDWRDSLDLSKGSSNRTLTALKAALNLAVANRLVQPSQEREWKDVKPFPNASQRRTLFLDLKQRRALLEAARGGLKDLIEAAALTGARAGELTALTRRQFDERLGTITFSGKTGARSVPVSAAAKKLFKRLAKKKAPAAALLTRDDGKPWAHSDWDGLVRTAATQAKLPAGTCLYTLRHSFITQAITDGMTTLDVARLCGTSVGMIEKHYGHLVASSARARLAAVTML
jgi:integrase